MLFHRFLRLPIIKDILKIRNSFHNYHHSFSVLYTGGKTAREGYAGVTPFIDFNETFSNIEHLKRNLELRKCKLDLNAIISNYQRFSDIRRKIKLIDAAREKVAGHLRTIAAEDKSGDLENQLKDEGRKLKRELKNLKEELNSIEERFIDEYLQLPNCLDARTPETELIVLCTKNEQKLQQTDNIMNHLSRKDLIDYKDDLMYYLLGDAAIFDWEFPNHITSKFLHHDFIQVSNPDFARKVLLEATIFDDEHFCQVVEDPAESKTNTTYLVGGGSAISFLGYATKLSIFNSTLPIKLISSGRQYYKVKIDPSCPLGLYSAMQSTCVAAFIASETKENSDTELEKLLELTIDIYEKLNLPFRVVYTPASELNASESLRVSIQAFSSFQSKYIEIGHINNYNDFISKRLLFNVRDKRHHFPMVVAGILCDVTKTIACLIENNLPLQIPNE